MPGIEEEKALNPTVLDKVRKHVQVAHTKAENQLVEPAPKSSGEKAASAPPAKAPNAEPETEVSPRADDSEEDGDEGEQAVPVKRFVKMREERNAARKAHKQLEKEIADLRKEVGQASDADEVEELLSDKSKPKGFDDMPLDRQQAWVARQAARQMLVAELGDDLDELRQTVAERRIVKQVGQLPPEQIAAVLKVTSKYPGMPAAEALVLAKSSNPKAFGAQKGIPPSHSVESPGQGSVTEPRQRDDHGRYLEKLREEPSPSNRMRMAVDRLRERLTKKK